MNLLEKFTIGKKKLLNEVGTNTLANLTVETYLAKYGFDTYAFPTKVRDFFVESRHHRQRLAYRDAIAACLGLDMTKPRDRDTLWWKVATEQGLDRKMRINWNTGHVDPQLEQLDTYFPGFYDAHPNCKEPESGDILDPVRVGIARTLTYIRLFPPENPLCELPDAALIPTELTKCWDTLRRHVHYRRHRNLNQHALDSVRDPLPNRFWMENGAIGSLKLEIEGDPSDTVLPFWFWPWAIFKYATIKQLTTSNKTTVANPHRWIWNTRQNGRSDLWSVDP
jgi:hypothetical protein